MDPRAGVGSSAVELEPLVLARVLHAGLAQVLEDHRLEVARAAASLLAVGLGRRALLVGRDSTRCGERLSTVNGP